MYCSWCNANVITRVSFCLFSNSLSVALMLVSVEGCVNVLVVDFGFVWICMDLYKISVN